MKPKRRKFIVACVFSEEAQWYGHENSDFFTPASFKCKFGSSPVFGFLITARSGKEAQNRFLKHIPPNLTDHIEITEVQKYIHEGQSMTRLPQE